MAKTGKHYRAVFTRYNGLKGRELSGPLDIVAENFAAACAEAELFLRGMRAASGEYSFDIACVQLETAPDVRIFLGGGGSDIWTHPLDGVSQER